MSDNIDKRIVEMSFENSKFEDGILKSTNSLKDFNNALKNTVKEDFSGMDRSVKDLSSSFSVFREIAVGGLRQIGAEAVRVGYNMLKSLAVDPITQGFQEMELKMNSTQTIMASTGETLAVVNNYLRELNEYSDRTIYSFSDMTQNIGKFTNAGVKLELAVASIKGISNAAALAGANSAEASRAMYNFAQALSAGYVKLIDWKSIENANMATVEFKQQLLESAVAAGTVTKTASGMYQVLSTDAAGKTMNQAISATRNFNESLSFQWMTTDALTKTLANYADETTEIGKKASKAATQVTTFTKLMDTLKESVGSGWAQTFELIFGDFNEARDLWTGMNDTIGAMIGTISDARNTLLSGGLASGWKQFMQEGIDNTEDFSNTLAIVAGEAGLNIDKIVEKAGSMEKAVRQSLSSGFSNEELAQLTASGEVLKKELEGSWLTGEMLTKTISKMSDKLENLSEEELRNAGYTEKSRTELLALRDALRNGTVSAEEFAAKMGAMSGRENIIRGLKNSVVALLAALKPISKAFDQIFPPATAKTLFEITENFKNFTKSLIIGQDTANKIQRTFAGLFAVLDIGVQVFKFLGNSAFEVAKALLPIGDGVLSTTASLGDFLVSINNFIKSSGVFQYGLLGVKVAMTLVRDILSATTGKVMDFASALWNAEDPIEFIRTTARNAFSGLLDTVKMVVTWISGKFTKALSGAQNILSSLFGEEKSGILSSILEILKTIVEFVSVNAVEGFKNLGDTIKNIDFRKIATFVTGGVLLLFVKQISDLTGALTGLTKTAATTLDTFTKKLFGAKTTTKIRDIAYAIGILAASIWVLSTIPAEDLKKSLIGLAGAVTLFVAAYGAIEAIKVASSKALAGKEVVTSAFGLVGLATALAVMAGALKTINKIPESSVWNSVAVLGAMLGFVAAYQALSALISKIPGQNKVTLNLFGISAALAGLVGALAMLNAFPSGSLQSALGKMTVILVAIATIQQLFGVAARIGGGNKLAVSFLGVAAGIAAMIGVLKLVALVDVATINAGIGNMARIVLLMAGIEIVLGLAARIGGGKKVQNSVLSTQVGMLAMVGLVALLSLLKQEDIDRGLVALGAMAGIIGAIEVLTAASARLAGGAKVQKILASVAVTMLSFTAIIAILGSLDQTTVDNGMIALTKMTGLIVAIELFTAFSARIGTVIKDGNVVGSAKAFTSLVGVTVAVIALAGALALLSMVDQEALRQSSVSLAIASVAIAALSVAISVMMSAMKSMSSSMSSVKNILTTIVPGLAATAAVLVATAGFFHVMKQVMDTIGDISTDEFTMFITATGFMATLFTMLGQIPVKNTNLAALGSSFLALAGVVVSTVGFFHAFESVREVLRDSTWGELAKFAAGLTVIGVLLAGVSLLAIPLSIVGGMSLSVIAGAAAAIAVLGLVVGGFVLLSDLMSGLDGEKLAKGMDTLVSVGEGIGRFVGSVLGGIAMETLTGIGEGLSSFAKSFSGIPADSFDGIKALAEAMLALTGAAVVDGLSRFITLGKSPAEVFGKQLKALVDAFKDISPEDAKRSSDVLAALAPMAGNLTDLAIAAKEIPNSGGLSGLLSGNNDIDSFGTDLVGLVSVFTKTTPSLAQHASDVLTAMVPMITNLGKFATAAQNIPNSGGFLGVFLGNNDIDTFGTMLTNFVHIFDAVEEVTVNKAAGALAAMEPMAGGLRKFADAASDIPNSGGFMGDFLGSVSLKEFSDQIHGLIGTFGGINETMLSSASSTMRSMTTDVLPALRSFSELSNGLKNSGGLAQLFSGNTTLTEFGTEIANFVRTVSYVKFSVVEPTLKGLAEVVTTFENLGTDSLTNAKKAFEKNKEPFQSAIASIVDAPVRKIKDKKTELKNATDDTFSSVTSESSKYVKTFTKLGEDVVDGLKLGFAKKKASAVVAIEGVMSSVVTSAKKVVDTNSPSRVFATIGAWCTKGLAVGLERETNVAVTAGENMAKATEESVRSSLGVHSLSEKFASIGEWLPKSIGEGVQNGKGWLLEKASSLGIDTGNLTAKGLATGVAGGEGMITEGISSLLDRLTGTSAVTSASSGTGTSIGDSITESMNAALADSTSGLGGSGTKSVVKSQLDKLKSYVEEEKFYGRMGLEEELAEYEKLRYTYKKGTAERKELDREVYTLMKSIYEAQLSYIEEVRDAENEASEERLKAQAEYEQASEEASADAAERLADLKKKYDNDVFSARVSADEKVQSEEKSYYAELNRILDRAEQDRQSIREQYAQNQKSINSKLLADIDAQNKAYEDAVKSRADTIYGSYGLFSAVEPDSEVSGGELLKNLQDQGAALSEWEQSLNALAERGVGDKLVEELQKMGPSSKAQIKALLTLTDEQLTEYVSLYEGKYAFARKKAEIELEGLKDSTAKAIQDLNAQAAIDLDALEVEFKDSMTVIDSNMAIDLEKIRATHKEALDAIEFDLVNKLTSLESEWNTSSSQIEADLVDKLNEIKANFNDTLSQINSDLGRKLTDLKSKFSSTMKDVDALTEDQLRKLISENNTKLSQLNVEVDSKLSDIAKTYDKNGNKIVSNFSDDMTSLETEASSGMGDFKNTLTTSLNTVVTKFGDAGKDAASGFAQGLRNGTYLAELAAEYLAQKAVDAARKVLDEHSPSRVFAGIGQFVSMGFANGITDYASQAEKASEELANGPISLVSRALQMIGDSIENNPEWTPVITPVLDLSNIKSVSGVLGKRVDFSGVTGRLANETVQNGSSVENSSVTIINNYAMNGLTVRSDADVDAIASKLYQKQQTALRGKGTRAMPRR